MICGTGHLKNVHIFIRSCAGTVCNENMVTERKLYLGASLLVIIAVYHWSWKRDIRRAPKSSKLQTWRQCEVVRSYPTTFVLLQQVYLDNTFFLKNGIKWMLLNV